MRTIRQLALCAAVALVACSAPGTFAAEKGGTSTPPELVGAYETLADSILAIKKTEWHMVHSILATTYSHAQATLAAVQRKAAGGDAAAEIEKLADLVSQLGNEGDAAVAAVRKRLIDGGHHHNAAGEKQGVFDEGFVIVTRAARKAFLTSAGSIAKLGGSPDPAKLEAEWRAVSAQYDALVKGH
jgi:hypothetical protein